MWWEQRPLIILQGAFLSRFPDPLRFCNMPLPSARIVFDVGLTLAWRGFIMTGIPRVEAEIATALLKRKDSNILFCRYRSKIGAFQRIPSDVVLDALLHPRLRAAAYRPPRPNGRHRRIWKAIEAGWRRYLFRPSDLLSLGPYDAYICVGAWWNLQEPDISIFGRLISQTRSTLMCHDVIPLLFPGSFEDPEVAARFRRSLQLFSDASCVVCNSLGTQQDLTNALRHADLNLPQMGVIPLAPGVSQSHPKSKPPFDDEPKNFVLPVGSISQRKNQAMLLDVWSRLGRNEALKDVALIVAGGWGEKSGPVRDRLQRDPCLAKRVMIMNTLSDEELNWLYRNCLFTVYPSLYEGWGLPIGESLSFGKLCIASDTPSMLEAGQGLCIHVPPTEPELWLSTLHAFLSHPGLLDQHESRIRTEYTAPRWSTAAEMIVDVAHATPPRGVQNHA